MLLSKRSLLLSLAALPLAGCGFTPIYGEDSAASALQGKISVDLVRGRHAFELRQALENRFGITQNARYQLSFDLNMARFEQGLTSTATISRYVINGKVAYSVLDTTTGAVVFKANEIATSSYSATSSTFPTRIAERDARARLADRLAELMIARITSHADGWAA